jgi:hypothetical protein
MAHVATATHRPKTARRRVIDIVGVLLQYKKYLLVIPTKPDDVHREEKLGRGSVKQQYFFKRGTENIFRFEDSQAVPAPPSGRGMPEKGLSAGK